MRVPRRLMKRFVVLSFLFWGDFCRLVVVRVVVLVFFGRFVFGCFFCLFFVIIVGIPSHENNKPQNQPD